MAVAVAVAVAVAAVRGGRPAAAAATDLGCRRRRFSTSRAFQYSEVSVMPWCLERCQNG